MDTFLAVHAQITSLEESGCLVDGGIPTLKCLEVIFGNIITLATGLVLVILFSMFVTGSFLYLTAGDSEEKVAKAQSTFKWAVIGLLLFMGSYLILTVIDTLFLGDGFSLFNFSLPQ